MFSFRFAVVPFVLAMSAATSAIAGAGTLTATVTPVSPNVTYSITGTSSAPALEMFVGYKMFFKNEGGNTINNVNVTFSLNNTGMTLFDPATYLPPGCAAASDNKTFTCAIIQMKSGDTFPEFVFFYRSPTDPTPTNPNDLSTVTSNVHATYAEGGNGSNPSVNSDKDIGGLSVVTLGTVNEQTIKSAIPKTGGTLRSGNAGVPTDTNKATELLLVPALATNYASASIKVEFPADPDCLTQGHFVQCPLYTTSVPNPTTGLPLQFTTTTPLTLIYRVHPSNLKMSAAQILNSVLIFYLKDGASAYQQVTQICPTAGTSNNSGVPCIASAPLCYKSNNAPTPGLVGVCEWKLNNIENGLLKLQ